ncbi:MAG: MlaD family protein, partial [Saprospiraceae bacterium]
MSREIKIGILVFLVLVSMIWGYTFLKGRNLLTSSNELHTTYHDVADLNVSSPVLVNGYKIGTVTKIKLNRQDVKKMDVFYLIDGNYKIPKNAIANLKSLGFVDGKGIFLDFDKECSGDDCALDGDELAGGSIGLLGSMLGTDEISEYSNELTESFKTVISNIGKEGEQGAINETFRNLEVITSQLAKLTTSTNELMRASSANINKSVANITTLTQSLAKSSDKIEGMLSNMDKITGDLAKANLGKTVENTNETLLASKSALTELKTTLSATTHTMNEFQSLVQKMEKGDGSIAKLLNDGQMYKNLEATTRNMNLLMQDLRLNPKRYAHFSIFGKKQKLYILPEDDPAS